MFGVLDLGATVVGVCTWAERRELEYYLGHSDATAIVATASFVAPDFASRLESLLGYELHPVVGLAADCCPQLETVVLCGADLPGEATFDGCLAGSP